MLNNVFSSAAKKHTVAITLYSIYITIWLGMCYLTYYYLSQGDADTLQGILFYWTMGFCVPYLIINIILSYYHPTDRRFFHEMCTLIFIPISLVILVWIEHGIIAYYRKGI
jgi:small-conductance mechanosensitive channel